MAFDSNTYIRVLKALNVSIAKSELIENALVQAENNPDLVLEIESTLQELDSTQSTLTARLNDPNASLIQADVLRWSDRERKTFGLEQTKYNLQLQLANLLGLDWWVEDRKVLGWGTSSVGIAVY